MGLNDGKETKHPISLETIEALIESQSKSTEQQVLIASALHDLVDSNKAIAAKLSNGLKDEIVAKVEEKLNNSCMAQDIKHTKWFVGIVAVVIIIANVIIKNTLFGPVSTKEPVYISEMSEEIRALDRDLKRHAQQKTTTIETKQGE
jgi:hypothetical protein